MESVLDSIAQGQQDWEQYLLDWHRRYFGPAVQWARQQLGQVTQSGQGMQQEIQQGIGSNLADRADLDTQTLPKTRSRPSQAGAKSGVKSQARSSTQSQTKSDSNESYSARSSSRSPKKSSPKSSKVASTASTSKTSKTSSKKSESEPESCPSLCPSCGDRLDKVPSQSPKLQANHFLRCHNPTCGTVMFWNKTKQQYELPYAKRSPNTNVRIFPSADLMTSP